MSLNWKRAKPSTDIHWTMIFLDEEANVNESFYFALGHEDKRMLHQDVTDSVILSAIQDVAKFNGETFSSLEELEEWYDESGLSWGEHWWMVCDSLQVNFQYQYVIPFDHQWWLFEYKRSWQQANYFTRDRMAWHPTRNQACVTYTDKDKAAKMIKVVQSHQVGGTPAKLEEFKNGV